MAPYAIAHMKIGLKLYETGYRFASDERARIYLTNSLEPPSDEMKQREFEEWAPALAHEAHAVNAVKRNHRFTVVTGNPPYSLLSQNLTESARAIVDAYRKVNGVPIKERGALQFEKILQDDYVKFFRWSQDQIDGSHCGILALITNHAFIDNPTLRGMRYSLLSSFKHIYCLNLHGNSSKKERNPDGSVDENVFDIQQGVAIFHGLQFPAAKSELRLCCDLWGTRDSKYATLSGSSLASVPYKEFVPVSPYFLFKSHSTGFGEEYERGLKLTDMFEQGSMGVVTARDHVSISFEDEALLRTATEFRDSRLSNDAVCKKLDIPEKKGWDVAKARALIKKEKNLKSFIKLIDYRPFDSRKIFYHRSLVWGMSRPTMQHILDRANVSISTTRSIEAGAFRHVFTSRHLIGHHFVSLKEVNYCFPLWLYPDKDSLALRQGRTINLKPEFVKAMSIILGLPQSGIDNLPHGITAEELFHYAYGVLHSPGYRSRYAEFLKMDFPRLPLTGNLELFRALSRLGDELVALHLLESPKLDKAITTYTGLPKPEVEKVSHSRNTVWLDKALTRGFRGVPEAVWNFYIGGYQVCEKWLKDRKGRTLSKDDIKHYHKIIVALSETIRLMKEIDKVIENHGGWPAAFTLSHS
jgi:predicted helicase